MGKTNRWMTWVLEESACTDVTMPWARGTRPDWKERLAVTSPELSAVVQSGLRQAASASRVVSLPLQEAS